MKNLKTFLPIVTIFHLLIFSAKAQDFSVSEVGNRSNLSDKNYYTPQLSFYAESFNKNSNIGFYNFSLLTETWGQAYAGILFKPVQWFTVSFGAGMETHKELYRLNINFQAIKNKFNFLQIYEYGGTGLWYNNIIEL